MDLHVAAVQDTVTTSIMNPSTSPTTVETPEKKKTTNSSII